MGVEVTRVTEKESEKVKSRGSVPHSPGTKNPISTTRATQGTAGLLSGLAQRLLHTLTPPKPRPVDSQGPTGSSGAGACLTPGPASCLQATHRTWPQSRSLQPRGCLPSLHLWRRRGTQSAPAPWSRDGTEAPGPAPGVPWGWGFRRGRPHVWASACRRGCPGSSYGEPADQAAEGQLLGCPRGRGLGLGEG